MLIHMARQIIFCTFVLLWVTGSADTTAGNNDDQHFSGSRGERAAEILATSENQQTISTTSTVLTESFNETITSTTGTTESSFVNSTDAVTMTSPSTSTTSEATTTQSGNVTTTLLPPPANTTSVPQHDADYPADYHNVVTSSTDDMLEEITTTDKNPTVTHVKVEISTTTISPPREISTEATLVSATTTEETSHQNASMSRTSGQQLLTAVGRALSQEESVPWPEAKSTKVIGTIIEDIQSPFSSSDSTARNDALNNGSITAIVLCTFVILLTTFGASGYWWYRRRYQANRPETLSDRYAPSETGAGEDIFRVGYVHSPELPRQDSSEEMYSLDNDSFLTSLEAMTIPTYWTETIKHTKL